MNPSPYEDVSFGMRRRVRWNAGGSNATSGFIVRGAWHTSGPHAHGPYAYRQMVDVITRSPVTSVSKMLFAFDSMFFPAAKRVYSRVQTRSHGSATSMFTSSSGSQKWRNIVSEMFQLSRPSLCIWEQLNARAGSSSAGRRGRPGPPRKMRRPSSSAV
jgi:hypothetical protein